MRALRGLLETRMNLEMAVTDEMLAIACEVRPADCCLVPERRAELTTEGGLDVARQAARIAAARASGSQAAGVRVALFIDPEPRADRGRGALRRAGDRAAHRRSTPRRAARARRPSSSGCAPARASAASLGLEVHAGHGLNYHNVEPVAAHRGDRRAQHRPRDHRATPCSSGWRRRCAR